MACSDDFNNKTNAYLHMFISKRMDEKVYDEKEGMKLWEESEKLWTQIDTPPGWENERLIDNFKKILY